MLQPANALHPVLSTPVALIESDRSCSLSSAPAISYNGGARRRADLQLQGSTWRSDFQFRTASRSLRSTRPKAVSVVCALTTSDCQVRGKQWSWDSGRCKPGAEVQSLCDQGQLDKALNVLLRMDQQGTAVSVSIYRCVLKACAKKKALAQAKRVHAHLLEHGLEGTRFLGEHIVTTLVQCGGLQDALQVFCRLPHRTVVSWTALISGYTTCRQGQEALRLYRCMLDEGLVPDKYTFVSILRACGNLSDLNEGKHMHAEAVKYGYGSDLHVGTSLVDMYGKCGSILDAQKVFNGLSHLDVVVWSAMLAAYIQQGEADIALQLYEHLLHEGICANERTFMSVLQACCMLADKEEAGVVDGHYVKVAALQMGKATHMSVWRNGFSSDLFVGNTLVSMYGKCGSILDVQCAFDMLSKRDVVTWTALLAAYIQQDLAERTLQLYEEMHKAGVSSNDRTLVVMLQACSVLAEEAVAVGDQQPNKLGSLKMGKVLHANAWSKGYDSNVFVGNSLIVMYANCDSIGDAEMVFAGLSERDVVSWNVLLLGYVQHDQAEKALLLYEQMHEARVSPNKRTFVNTLQACGNFADKEEGIFLAGTSMKGKSLEVAKALHADASRRNYSFDVFIANTIIDVYRNCGSLADAEKVFDGLFDRDVVSWTVLLAAYVEHGQATKAMELYEQMWEEGVSPDNRTFVSVLQACAMLAEQEEEFVDKQSIKVKSLERGMAIHAAVQKKAYDVDLFVGSTLIGLYAKCGSIVDAQNVFDGLSRRDLVSCNAMLAVYAKYGLVEKALHLHEQMSNTGMSLDDVTLVCILQACGNAGRLDVCRQMHQTLLTRGNNLSLVQSNILIHAYGGCGSMVDAKIVFQMLVHPDVVSWTSLILGYARQGNYGESIRCYEEMQLAGVEPDGVTFLSLLSACSHAGLVDKGVEFFEMMSKHHGITPWMEHYVSMVDLLGRAGHFSGVEHLLSTMPLPPNLAMWSCLLGACQKHGKLVLGRHAFDCAVHLEPKQSAAYVLMWNIYADAGRWDDAFAVYQLRQNARAWKEAGQSWIEHRSELYNFVTEDFNHPRQSELYDLLHKVSAEHEKRDFQAFLDDFLKEVLKQRSA